MNSNRRRFLTEIGALGVPAGFALTGTAGAADRYTMRLSFVDTTTSVVGQVALRFASQVARRTNGQVQIEVYPNGQLISQAEGIDALTTGVLDYTLTTVTFLQRLFPRYQVFDLPFIFKDAAAGFRVLDGPIGVELFTELETKGIMGLTWGVTGLKEFETVNKVITVPDDMKGQRFRILGGAVVAATYQALGAIPVTIDASEIFTALSQHTIDGIDVNLDGFTANKWYTQMKHVAFSHHVFSVLPLLGSKRKIEALPPAMQTIVKQEAKALIPFWRSLTAKATAEDIDFLKKNGITFNEIKYPLFRKAVEPVYALLQSRLGGDLIDRVARAAGSA